MKPFKFFSTNLRYPPIISIPGVEKEFINWVERPVNAFAYRVNDEMKFKRITITMIRTTSWFDFIAANVNNYTFVHHIWDCNGNRYDEENMDELPHDVPLIVRGVNISDEDLV